MNFFDQLAAAYGNLDLKMAFFAVMIYIIAGPALILSMLWDFKKKTLWTLPVFGVSLIAAVTTLCLAIDAPAFMTIPAGVLFSVVMLAFSMATSGGVIAEVVVEKFGFLKPKRRRKKTRAAG